MPMPSLPVPGSPGAARVQHIAYDEGVHKIARLAALLAYALMVATVVFGVLLRTRFAQRHIRRQTLYGAHMVLALTAVVFSLVHGLTFIYQPVWRIALVNLVVPFVGGVQKVPVGFGVLGLELALAVGVSVWAQRRLGYRRWLRLHQGAYVAFLLVWLHIITVNPEPRTLSLVGMGVAAGAGACFLLFTLRLLPADRLTPAEGDA
ncbi:ferric reductase-like transmembrane domain-containing protein [Streptomyces sp. RB6PN25]|uniref:Ferric reductase-like transmembrane domain-containing protein n=1 Tax=Streptomyces humicola TaxID=2953240 RepID=A0ABT1Q8K4_9ACTN|nr:ferric reductase-like transmembrane domain-containing protein [Streptomyces humicola]MCQ4085160.1 ferric reductase-like transmembrane domain-containing protein [Streptomyces humicola]